MEKSATCFLFAVVALSVWRVALGVLVAESEHSALLNLKKKLNPDNSQLTSWNVKTDCSKWDGLVCDSNGHVIEIALYYYDFNSLSPSIGLLSRLQKLKLSYCNLVGGIPSAIGNLSNLNELYLDGNLLSGILPNEMANLLNLTTLNLESNNFTGTLDPWIGNLTNLQTLSLSFNQFHGPLPKEISKLKSLTYLHLAANNFNGEITPLGKLRALNELKVYRNRLSGFIPSEVYLMQNLEFLDLSYNQLSGKITSEISFLRNLKLLYVFIDLTYELSVQCEQRSRKDQRHMLELLLHNEVADNQ